MSQISQAKDSYIKDAIKDYSRAGLTSSKAKEKLEQFGENTFAKEKLSIFKTFFKQLFNPLNFILLFAAALSFYLREYSDSIIIVAIVLINSFLSFVQEFRSEKAVEKLSELLKPEALAIRDSKQVFIDVSQLVPGDTVILRDGDIVPADVKIMEASDLSVNESQLTGESVPVNKKPDNTTSSQNSGLLFTGSVIEQGSCQGVVYATGSHTELGKIALLSKDTKKTTPYQKSLSGFSFSVMRIIGVTIILILVTKSFGIHNTDELATVILFTIALAMTVVPEALPMVMTVNLSSGALKLAKQKVIVKRLSAIEDLGRIDILCTDKTGTLTEDRLAVTDIVSNDELLFKKLAFASLEDAGVKNNKRPSSLSRAFENYVPKNIQAQVSDWIQRDSLPFDPNVRRRRVIVEDPKTRKFYLVVIGSLEVLLSLCTTGKHHDYDQLVKQTGKQGKRQIAISYKLIDYKPGFNILANENHLTFLGFVDMLDPLRSTAKETIKTAEALGVQVKILTGDSIETATYVGQEVGLIKEGERVYSGAELDKMNNSKLGKVVQECAVFARVTPEQKYRIIQQLKTNNIVGYQGDGINDAPSLKLADASIAVKNATDVAKDSADIILMESNLKTIINGIRYGRSIFVNINKYIKHAMVGNIGNFFSLAFFYVVFAAGLPMLPIQLLIANLIQDMPLMTIFSDRVDDKEVKKPLAASQVKSLIRTSLLLGTFTAIYYLIYFLFVGTASSPTTQTNLFIFFNLTQLLIIISVRGKDHFFWQGAKPSRLLLGTITFFIVGSIAITYIPLTANFMGFTALPMLDLAILIALAVAFIFMLDLTKVGLNKLQTSFQRH